MKWYRSSRILQRGILLSLGMFVMAPLVWTVVRSLEDTIPYQVIDFSTFVMRFLSLKQYGVVLFHDYEYWVSYWNSIFLMFPTVFLAVVSCSMAAYGLVIMIDKIQNKIQMVYVILSLLPMQVLLVPQLIALSNLHLTGTRLAVILISSFSPWYVIFIYRLCRRIPKEVLEMARVEGAREWKIFQKIAIPQMRVGLLIFGMIISADLWGMVEEPLVYIQDSGKYPLSVLFREMGYEVSFAGVILYALPMVLLFLMAFTERGAYET